VVPQPEDPRPAGPLSGRRSMTNVRWTVVALLLIHLLLPRLEPITLEA
jgi:hypothetical protein